MNQRTPRTLLTISGLCLCTAFAAGQGADDCSNAQAITGTGTFDFDTTTSTTDGYPEAIWSIPGIDQIESDVWFAWTAPSSSAYEISTNHSATQHMTAMAVYEFGCSTTQGRAMSARGDNDLAFSTLTIGTEAGQEYLIRIGHVNTTIHITGKFTITEVGHPGVLGSAAYPANGRTYYLLEASSWNVAQMAAVQLGGNLVTVNDQAENDWLQQTFWNWGGQQRSLWLGYNDREVEGNWTWVSGETPGYSNWSTPEPNNSHGYEHYAHFRYDWVDGSWNDNVGDPVYGFFYNTIHGVVEVDGYDPGIYCVGDGSGTPCPCGNDNDGSLPGAGCANGQYVSGARLTKSGTASVSNDTLVLIGEHTEHNQSGLFFQADNDLSPGNVWGDGLQCAGGQLRRLGVRFSDATGYSDTSAWTTPISVRAGNVSAGDTKYYQLWYRNPSGSPCATQFNASNGYRITWLP